MAPLGRAWFRPRRHGVGAKPSTWQGWALMAGFVVALGAVLTTPLPADRRATGAGLLTAALVFISWAKTEGGWRWRWGQDD